jgi:hypothetical protein
MGRLASLALVILIGSASVAAQSSSLPPAIESLDTEKIEIRERSPGWDMLPFELTRDAERLVRITSAEKKRHEKLRKAGGFKMVKIFSAPSCASKRYVVDVSSDDCLSGVDLIRTSFYSLARGLYGESISDIRIIDQVLHAGNGGMHHGMVMDLGVVDPTGIRLSTEEVDRLIGLETATTFDEEVEIRERLREGLDLRGNTVRASATLNQGHTYLIRLINYSYKRGSRNMFQRDVVYLVHFAELNKDRTALFLWRKLSDKAAPRL